MRNIPENKRIPQALAITAGFNTLIALVLTFILRQHAGFQEVLVISQFIGLSICLVVSASLGILDRLNAVLKTAGIILGLLLGICSGGLLSWAYLMLFRENMGIFYFLTDIFYEIAVFGIIFGVPIIYFFFSREKISISEQQVQAEKIKRLTLEKEAAMLGIRVLQAQIEPHFLFNTLSSIGALMDADPAKAKKMLNHLNEYLRITLERTRKQMITLDRELDLVRHYLDIFKIRMGKRLRYDIRDDTGLGSTAFPPLILQPLVENAVKYGLESKVEGGRIRIRVLSDDKGLLVTVSDDGTGLDPSGGSAGIAVNNISRRLDALYGGKAGLTLRENKTCGMTSEVRIPL